MTLLAVPIFGSSIEQIRRDIERAVKLRAEVIELRVDLMEGVGDDDLRSLRDGIPEDISVILTIRSKAEGGQWDGADDERVARMIELGPIADYIDVELATWLRSANIRQKLRLALGLAGHVSQSHGKEENAQANKRRLILSRHDLTTRPPTLQADLLTMLDETLCRLPKLVWRARTIRDNFEAFELMRQSPRPSIIICMGEAGLISRLLAKKFGAFATFVSSATGHETAAGQPSLQDVKALYRWNAIDAETLVYGVIADPVRHSLSPRAHNAAFATVSENAVFLPMQVGPSYESFKAFMVEVQARPWLDFRGFSVTIPHKENALRYLDETGGVIDPSARRIGAVNTLTLSRDGSLAGYNTDCAAALDAIRIRQAGANRQESNLSGLSVAVLGAGGAARAVVSGLADAGADVTVFNRTEARAQSLAKAFGCRSQPWEKRVQTKAALLVNCTSVGLWPNVGESPMPAESLTPEMTVFDTIYNPLQTRLLREAAQRGCAIIAGVTMFALQAQAQFRLWTGRSVPLEVFRQAAESGTPASTRLK